MNNNVQSCTCPADGLSPHCPQAFMQGGKILHEVIGDARLKQRVEIVKDGGSGEMISDGRMIEDIPLRMSDNGRLDNHIAAMEKELKTNPRMFSRSDYVDNLSKDIEGHFPDRLQTLTIHDERLRQSTLTNSEDFLAQNRTILRKYEPLRVGENTLTEMSIGGYIIDPTKAAQKAALVVPLPPAKLPKIFIDSEMNFNHHFFQGFDRLIGRAQLLDIVSKTHYYTDEDLLLLPIIEDIINVGYEQKDSNLTVFTKSVLSSTFELDSRSTPGSKDRGLIVAANLWGFQYIESGMECKEVDLKMWLKVCYDRYKTIFFNNFKDSGLPAFSTEGVQTRYEPVKVHQADTGYGIAQTLSNQQKSPRDGDYYDDDTISVHSTRSRRHKKPRRHEQTIGASLFGRQRR